MRRLRLMTGAIVAISVASLAATGVLAQAPTGQTTGRSADTATGPTIRTAWGHPDLQGIWDFRTVTPMERPPELAGKATLTAEEAVELERRLVESRNADR